MNEPSWSRAIAIRPAVSTDAEQIACIYMDSAGQHAELDPERYGLPSRQAISERYRESRQYGDQADVNHISFVAQAAEAIVGFIDVRLDRSPDPMHREMIYCHVAEIAISSRYRNRGIGAKLLGAAEGWGRAHGATFASLEYHARNTRAGAFYERAGYSVAAITAIKRL